MWPPQDAGFRRVFSGDVIESNSDVSGSISDDDSSDFSDDESPDGYHPDADRV
jgi:hypothetical protein